MALTQVAGGMLASSPTIVSPTFTGTSTFAGGVANAYGFGVGTAVPSSGAGIAFPATQSASSDANTLDDYEEGTWTPVPSPGSGSLTSYNSNRYYTKVGRNVFVTGQITIVTAGSAGGAFNISGFPFANPYGYQQTSICRECAATGQNYAFYINSSASTGAIQTLAGGSGSWSTGYQYSWSLWYQLAA